MPQRQVIHNGRTGRNARSKPVVVVRCKLPTTKKIPDLERFTEPLKVSSHRQDGSDNQILVVRLSRHTSLPERGEIEAGLKSKCEDLFFALWWRDNGNLKITMNTRTNNCCCSDILTCVREVLSDL
jgi:hypothetical protein